MANKSKAYKFDDRTYSGQSILSTVSSVSSVIIFLALAFHCTSVQEGAGEWAGSFGFTGFIAAFYGMASGLDSFRIRSRSYAMSKAGTLLGGLMVAVWFLVFCVGLAQ